MHRQLLTPAPAPPSAPDGAYRLLWGVPIPLRDGVRLNATVYLPGDSAESPTPAVVTITPYIADSYHERGRYFAAHGYAFVSVDHRGRGSSGGDFDPFMQMSEDGYDVVEWAAAQPWCDGQVAMWGGSYAGQNQWATLKARPPHLKTIVPAAAVHCGIDFPGTCNIFYSYETQWLTFTSGKTGNANLFGDQAFWVDKFRERFVTHRPFRELDQIVGNRLPTFQKWLDHPEALAYWAPYLPDSADYAAFDVPILTITGHFDGDQPGALHFYREHMRHGRPDVTADHYLVVGPWDHAGTRTPQKQTGGLTFGDAALVDLNALHKAWYDWVMKGGPRPEWLSKRVAYYVVGPEEWRFADSLDAIGAQPQPFYLAAADGRGGSVFNAGELREEPVDSPPLTYVYDPLVVDSAEIDVAAVGDDAYLLDQRRVLALDGDGFVFHSAPLARPRQVTGWLRLVLWLTLDVPDTDFYAAVYEITADGRSIRLGDALLRARYRHALTAPELVTPGALTRFEFDTFWFTARVLAAGSRLRLVVHAPNTVHLEKNYNSGGTVAEETAADARTAHVTLTSTPDHPSLLLVPLVD